MNVILDRLRSWEGFLLLVFVALFALNALASPYFLTVQNQINLFQLSIEKVIVAVIMTLVIINGEIDLSVASIMGLAASAFGWLFQSGFRPRPPLRWCCCWELPAVHSTRSGSHGPESLPWSSRLRC